MNGKVLRILDMKGFGFIKGDDGKEYFFHRDDYQGSFDDLVATFRTMHVNVSFTVAQSERGPRASAVYINV